jgi:3-isopropylmalate dehydrogenase
MLLAWLGDRRRDDELTRAAALIEQALVRVLASPDGRTRDLGGRLSTDAFARRVADALLE